MENNKLTFLQSKKFWAVIIVIQAITNIYFLQDFYNNSDSVFQSLLTTLFVIGAFAPAFLVEIIISGVIADFVSATLFLTLLFYTLRNLFSSKKMSYVLLISLIISSLLSLTIGALFLSGM